MHVKFPIMELRSHKQIDRLYHLQAVMFPQQHAITGDNALTLKQLNREMFEVRNKTINIAK